MITVLLVLAALWILADPIIVGILLVLTFISKIME